MKIRIPCATFAATIAVLALGGLACQAQTPEATPPAPNRVTPQAEGSQALQTRTFRVPRNFLSIGATSGGDPFDPNLPAEPTAKAVLESLGITFDAPGSKAIFFHKSAVLEMTNVAEQMDHMDELFGWIGKNTVLQGLVHLEVFSLPPLTARKALIAHPKEADLYAWLDAEPAKPDSTVKLERHSISVVRGGQKAKTEAIDEIPHPTKFEAPKIPQSIGLPVATTPTSAPNGIATFAPWPHTGPKPDSFETRHAGDTFELELTFLDDLKTVDLNLAPETSRRVGIAKFGLREDIHQPIYETQRSTGQASGRLGQPILISTFSPPVNTGVPGGNTAERTWLLFVTVTTPE